MSNSERETRKPKYKTSSFDFDYTFMFFFPQDGSLYHALSQKCVQAMDRTDNGTPAPALQPCSDSVYQQWFFEEKM